MPKLPKEAKIPKVKWDRGAYVHIDKPLAKEPARKAVVSEARARREARHGKK